MRRLFRFHHPKVLQEICRHHRFHEQICHPSVACNNKNHCHKTRQYFHERYDSADNVDIVRFDTFIRVGTLDLVVVCGVSIVHKIFF
ncbi:hypothetical protein MTR_8g070090 [Medicago truncatula]|uniref:Uncharacterized protein n=1 Tax=Medicago truncatula TaxID=3880 RepID=A0A072TTR6_MEDTR|nr:hypothetical protein MTR_8g070090 [Medicago truncatula]